MNLGQEALVERRNNVQLVTINRPEARNAINGAVCQIVGDALEEAHNDPNVRAVVITGAGDLAFSAGADLKALARGEKIRHPDHEEWGLAGYVRHVIDKPTIAAVNGVAFGGGAEIALASDLIVAAESATFGMPEVKRGLIPAAGGIFRLMRQLPSKKAMELLLTGEPISAAEAARWGLLNSLVPNGTALEAALRLAQRIAVNAPLAVQASKRVALGVEDSVIVDETSHWDRTQRENDIVRRSDDAMEGPRAFAEKRAPVWRAQ
ncbi:crotonase/enoyl-CoA hydratase family protein [Mycobacterium sp. UM_CSW]|uniref:crotonase/enoyl-CoA hydratase family protein n=1 Tax=Mycobacterium sp. UM_CSW TaxID=1370119 RepID=UPI0008347F13|nr:crotonase/enoyl-CoA hydratase family protein [Mycobacterium sp. UM_CSW]